MKRILLVTVILFTTQLFSLTTVSATRVETKGERIYIRDQTGELWDVTQAQSLGFMPEKFQYGIGKNAFTPLNTRDLTSTGFSKDSRERVIGINWGQEAQAYSINRLRYHEIANTTIGDKAIAVGY